MYVLTLAAAYFQQTDQAQVNSSNQTLALVIGYVLCALVGIAGLIVLWKMADGTINLARLISEPNGDASMSRFQFLIFTFVIALSLFLVIVYTKGFPTIPGTVLSLLGISSSSYLVSKGITFSDPNAVQDRALEVIITPSTASLRVGQTQQFKAEVPRKPGATLQWEVTAGYGRITQTGLYTADLSVGPAIPRPAQGAPAPAPPQGAAGPAQPQPPAPAPPQPPVHATIRVMADNDPELVDLAVVTITA